MEETFGGLLMQHLARLDRPQSWLADRLQVSPAQVNRWYNNSIVPKKEMVERIADVLMLRHQDREALFRAADCAVYLTSPDEGGTPASDAPSDAAPMRHISIQNGNYHEGEIRIERDMIQAKTVNHTEFHAPMTGSVHTGSGDIHLGTWHQAGQDASLQNQLAALQGDLMTHVPPPLQGQAMRRLAPFAQSLGEADPDLDLWESTLRWFESYLPTLMPQVVTLVFHPTVRELVSQAGPPVEAEFRRRLGDWDLSGGY